MQPSPSKLPASVCKTESSGVFRSWAIRCILARRSRDSARVSSKARLRASMVGGWGGGNDWSSGGRHCTAEFRVASKELLGLSLAELRETWELGSGLTAEFRNI